MTIGLLMTKKKGPLQPMRRNHSKYETCALCTNKNININIESMHKLQLGFQGRTCTQIRMCVQLDLASIGCFNYSKAHLLKRGHSSCSQIDKNDLNDK